MEYTEQMRKLGTALFELLSEALGLKSDHLMGIDCAEGQAVLSHYYPACPEPELTMGTSKHSVPDFLKILLQDHIGGLQVLHQNHRVNVPPVAGALVVNVGDLLQVCSITLSYYLSASSRFRFCCCMCYLSTLNCFTWLL